MRKLNEILTAFGLILLYMSGTISLATIPTASVTFENHHYTLHAVDGQGTHYYVEANKLHRYYPRTEKWERDLFTSSSRIMIVHVTSNNALFVGLRNGAIYRSRDGGRTFRLTFEWGAGGYCHTEWSIASDENWILIGEYGPVYAPRRVYASDDGGDTWTRVYQTPEQEGVHIHRVAIDPYTKAWWITVGDYPVAGRVLYSNDHGRHWTAVECPAIGPPWQPHPPQRPYQPCNILFFEQDILFINEPLPQVFKVNRTTMQAEYIATIGNLSGFAPCYSVVAGTYGIYASIIRYPEHTHDAGIFVSYDHGYTWQQLINFTEWAKKLDPSIAPSDVFGAHHLVYADGYIYGRWDFGWEAWEKWKSSWEEGRVFKFRDAYYAPAIQEYDVFQEDISNPVIIHSNSIVTHFNFTPVLHQIGFNVTGNYDTLGYCNVTIPKAVLNHTTWTITIDNVVTPNFLQTENVTHTSLYFTYTQITIRHIVIQGTEIPLGTTSTPPPETTAAAPPEVTPAISSLEKSTPPSQEKGDVISGFSTVSATLGLLLIFFMVRKRGKK